MEFAPDMDAVLSLGPDQVVTQLVANLLGALGIAGALARDQVRTSELRTRFINRLQQVVEMEVLEPNRIHFRRRNEPGFRPGVGTRTGEVVATVGECSDAADILRGVEIVEIEPVREVV